MDSISSVAAHAAVMTPPTNSSTQEDPLSFVSLIDSCTETSCDMTHVRRADIGSLLSPEHLYGFTPQKPGSVTIDELDFHGRKQLSEFSDTLNGLLKKEGIDISEGLDLGVEYGTGRVIVKDDHPHKERIEEIVNEETDLRNDYVRATNMLQFAEHGRHALQFQQAYALDPVAAVRQFSYLFNSDVQANVHISEDGFGVEFEWTPKS